MLVWDRLIALRWRDCGSAVCAQNYAAGRIDFSKEVGSMKAGAVLPLNHAIWACSNAFASGK